MPAAKDPYRYFRLEARELLEALGREILSLDQDGAAEAVQRMLRHAHTLKGAARVVKQVGIADEAHLIEDVLTPLRDAAGDITAAALETLSGHLARIDQLLRALETPAPDAAPNAAGANPATPAPEPATQQTVRTEIGEIDRLLEGLSEVHIRIGDMRQDMAALEEAQRLTELLEANLAPRALGNARRYSRQGAPRPCACDRTGRQFQRRRAGLDHGARPGRP